jgi:hypothetical protein
MASAVLSYQPHEPMGPTRDVPNTTFNTLQIHII